MENTNQFAASTYTGTGSAIAVTCGFKPACVLIANETDGDWLGFHVNGMAADSFAKLIAAPAKVTSGGITLTSTGFSVGTDATINESGDVFRYIAIGDISNHVTFSTYTGTGAAQPVTVGYKPRLVLAYNFTDGDELWGHIQGMTAATAFSITTATAAVSSQGCTLSSTGFTLGTDAAINENAKVYNFVTIGDIFNQVYTGSYSGSGVAQSIPTGFKPILFMTHNTTDGDTIAYSSSGMTAGAGFQFSTDALAITNGVTLNDRSVTVGTDASVNENAKTFVCVAL